MSYCRNPYYIFKNGRSTEFHKGYDHQGTIDYEGLGQFLVNLIDRGNNKTSEEFIDFIKMGLRCEREARDLYEKEDWFDKKEREMNKVQLTSQAIFGIIVGIILVIGGSLATLFIAMGAKESTLTCIGITMVIFTILSGVVGAVMAINWRDMWA